MRGGIYVYQVHWKGCPHEQDTSEPEDNLLTCDDDLLNTFKEEHDFERHKGSRRGRKYSVLNCFLFTTFSFLSACLSSP